MNIGNLLNDQSPKTKSASLSDLQQSMNEPQLGHDATAERRNMSQQHVVPHAGFNTYSYQSASHLPNYHSMMPTGYGQQSQLMPGPEGSPLIKQEGTVVSSGSDVRTLPSTHRASEGRSPDNPAPKPSELPKNFACSTCGKGFARRSDLVRHERIHSGIRPHKCPWPYCDKQFIQRSALTVHERVHSGEKPHMCEKCSKQFSDSSSLARHRRIHSGKRPYKCPYPDCQKTFTRRTTLTRHQNNHTGSLEEAAANRNAALASHASAQIPEGESSRGEGDAEQSDASSSIRSQQALAQAPHMQQPSNLSRAPSYGQGLPQSYYPQGALPPPAGGMGTPGPNSTPSSRAPSTVDSHHQYRPPVNAYPPTSTAHSASHSPNAGLLQQSENYHGYPQDPRYQQGYGNSYYQQQRQPAASHDPQGYEPHGQMNVPSWTASTQSM